MRCRTVGAEETVVSLIAISIRFHISFAFAVLAEFAVDAVFHIRLGRLVVVLSRRAQYTKGGIRA
jgi:hypothetical protein